MAIPTAQHDQCVTVRRYLDPKEWNSVKVDARALAVTLEKGCAALDRLGLDYWLASGTLLGFHRDGSFLPGDNDLDIDVRGDKDVYKIIRELPFQEIVRIVSADNRYMQFAFFDRETKGIFDIWFYHDDGERLINTNDFGKFQYPRAPFDQLTKFHFGGRDYPCPDPDWYCEYMYGAEWRTPKKYVGHWTEYYQKDCKGFTLTGNGGVHQRNFY